MMILCIDYYPVSSISLNTDASGLVPPSDGHACCGANHKHLAEDSDLQHALGHELEVGT